MSVARQPFFNISFPESSTTLNDPTEVDIIGEMGKHEVAIISYGYPDFDASIPEEGTPVVIEYGDSLAPTSSTFYGYVNHHEGLNDRLTSTLILNCIGTSLPLNTTRPAVWSQVSPNKVVDDVAKRWNLRTVQSRSPETITSWAQSGESDFHMLRRLAERVGYRFWVSNGAIYFVDPNIALSSTVPVQMNWDIPTDTLLHVKTLHGSLTPTPGARTFNYVYGVDNNGRTIKSTTSKSQALQGSIIGTTVSYQARSVQEAKKIADNKTDKGNWATAVAQIATTDPTPIGGLVSLSGSRLYGAYSGNWLVTGYSEKFVQSRTDRQFGTNRISVLQLARNQPTTHKTKGAQGFGSAVPRTTVKLGPKGLWQSSTSGTTYV